MILRNPKVGVVGVGVMQLNDVYDLSFLNVKMKSRNLRPANFVKNNKLYCKLNLFFIFLSKPFVFTLKTMTYQHRKTCYLEPFYQFTLGAVYNHLKFRPNIAYTNGFLTIFFSHIKSSFLHETIFL